MLGRIINHNTPYLLQRKDGTFNDPETGKKLGFDTRFMGKGEGAQVHGWGIYLSVADIRHYGNFHKRSIRIKEEIFDCEFIQYGQIKTIPLKVSRDEIRAYKLALTAGNIASHFDLIDCNPDDVKAYIQARIIESKAKIAEKESQPPSPRLAYEITNEKQRLEDYQYLLDRVIVKGTRHHYDVQIPDYDGVNYISEHGTVTAKQMDMIYSALSKANADALKARCKAYKGKATGRQVYVALWQILGSDEKASKLLNKAGFVGIHYYGGRDGECYVIFNEKDAQIVRHELYGLQGISNAQMQQRELEIVKTAREIISKYHGTESPLPYKDLHDCYTELVNYYNHQQTISPKDSVAISLQQYSTPCPIAFLMGEYIKGKRCSSNDNYYEPTAGNGMLTISLPHHHTFVNELDPVRHKNLTEFNYNSIDNEDALMYSAGNSFAGVIMNPPFGNLHKGKEIKRGGTIGGKDVSYTFGRIDYAIVVHTLEQMHSDGRAAIIVGGKLSAKVGDYSESYWKNGKLYGQYRDFIAYLHRQYNIADIIYIDGNLYRKQGTTFPIVLILIDGRTAWNGDLDHVWHRYNPQTDTQITTFDGLFARISKHFSPSISPLFDNEIALAKLYANRKPISIDLMASKKTSYIYANITNGNKKEDLCVGVANKGKYPDIPTGSWISNNPPYNKKYDPLYKQVSDFFYRCYPEGKRDVVLVTFKDGSITASKENKRNYSDYECVPLCKKEDIGGVQVWELPATDPEKYISLIRKGRELLYSGTFTGKKSTARAGRDWTAGKEITIERLNNMFNFRSIIFNRMNSADRQKSIENAFNAFSDLALILGHNGTSGKGLVSHGGKIGLVFGAKQSGNAEAYYRRSDKTINLTAKEGSGTLAHEWFHSLDNHLASLYLKNCEYLTAGYRYERGAFAEKGKIGLYDLLRDWETTLCRLDMYAASVKKDKRRKSGDYWSTIIELTARCFEVYCCEKLKEKGITNDFLVQVGKSDLYPSENDKPKVMDFFSRFFSSLREHWKGANISYLCGDTPEIPEIENAVPNDVIAQIPTNDTDRKTFLQKEFAMFKDTEIYSKFFNQNVAIIGKSIGEICQWACKSKKSVIAALNVDGVIANAIKVNEDTPKANKQSKDFHFVKMYEMHCNIKGVGTAKLMIGERKRGTKITYCLTAIQI